MTNPVRSVHVVPHSIHLRHPQQARDTRPPLFDLGFAEAPHEARPGTYIVPFATCGCIGVIWGSRCLLHRKCIDHMDRVAAPAAGNRCACGAVGSLVTTPAGKSCTVCKRVIERYRLD